MTQNIMRKLWWVPALAILAACDPSPYDDEVGGTPAVLEVMASPILDPGAPEDGAGDAIVDADGAANGWVLNGVPAGQTVFVVKTNKLLDGTSIQASPLSCAPAATLNLTVNTVVAPAGWWACYVPTAGTDQEGASVVIYQGANILPGIAGVGRGYLEQAALTTNAFTITAQPRDKQGNVLNISFTVNSETQMIVEHGGASDDLTVSTSVTFTATVIGITNQSVTWSVVETAGCGSITSGGVYTAPATVPTPDTCTIRATSVGDPTASADYEVTIVP